MLDVTQVLPRRLLLVVCACMCVRVCDIASFHLSVISIRLFSGCEQL